MEWMLKHPELMQPWVLAIFFGILIGGFFTYVCWAQPIISSARVKLDNFADLVEIHNPGGANEKVLNDAAEATPWINQAWKTTRSRQFLLGSGGNQRRVLMVPIGDVWHAERMLHKDFNLSLFEAVPNIAVGVGLFFTFLFLTFALSDATVALSATGTANPIEATKGLLSSAGGKFLSSLAGLLVSLVWTVMGKRAWARVQRASDRVVIAIESWWPPIGAEVAVVEQLAQLDTVNDQLREHHETAQDQTAVAGELLVEAQEQTGVLKRFETDLAMSIGKAVSAGFSPQMEQMTERLERAISDLSERMSSMNEDALRTMMQDFSQAISANTAEEMQQFKETLTGLSGKLDASAALLTSGVEDAAAQLGQATQGMTSGIYSATEKMSSDIAAAAQGLSASVGSMETVIARTTEAVQEIDVAFRRAASLGAQGVEQMDRSIKAAIELVDDLGDVGEDWEKISTDVSNLVGKLTEASDAVDEVSEGQRSVIHAVQSIGPEVVGVVTQMRSQMEGTSRAVADAMQQVQGAMGRTSEDLTGVVSAVKEGVTEYSRQLAALHLDMDTAMATAVGKLGGAIHQLEDTIEDLTDGLEAIQAKG
ncbi:hypothetical protein [Pigmentiphaga litoralis]|uniref:hypothetical protein n=1 Tax=Pigmentiphaga litoralis TaxID=516702 RepID=UPI003B43D1E5